MNVEHHQPQNKTLQKHIEYYYFLKTDKSNFETKYYAFPHIFTPLNTYKNAEIKIQHYANSVFETKQNSHISVIQGMRKQPFLLQLKGKIDGFTIVFNRLV